VSRAYRWLALLPALAILVGVPFANRVEPYVLGLPFLLFWILGCVLLTSAVMALVAALDLRRPADRADGRAGTDERRGGGRPEAR
jgi:hypothetical protein